VEFAGEQSGGLVGGCGEQDFAAVGVAAYAGCEVDGNAEDIAIGFEDFAVVDAATHLDGTAGEVQPLDAPLDGDGMGGRVFDGIEDDEKAIAKAADDASAGHGRGVVEGTGKGLEEPVGFDVAKLAREAQRSGDIDKKEGAMRRGEAVGGGGKGGADQAGDLRRVGGKVVAGTQSG